MNVLGLSAYGGESAAALIRDGRLVATASEARFAPPSGSLGVAWRAAAWCLASGGVSGENLDAVALAHKPLLALDRLLSAGLAYAPAGWARFYDEAARGAPSAGLGARLHARFRFSGPLLFVERLEALAAGAFCASGFERSALLVAGGRGEWADTALGSAAGGGWTLARQLDYPHGLSFLWEAFAWHLQIRLDDIPALAAAGQPRFLSALRRDLADLKPDGSLRLDMGYFGFAQGLAPGTPKLSALLGGRRGPDDPPSEREADAAASLQAFTVEALGRMAAQARRDAGSDDLCLAGAFACNEGALTRLRDETPGQVFIGTAPPGCEAALGAAAAAWRRAFQRELVAASVPATPEDSAPAPVCGVLPPLLDGTAHLAADILLACAYFLAITPYSLIARMFGLELVDERFHEGGTYWKARRPEGEGLRAYRRRF